MNVPGILDVVDRRKLITGVLAVAGLTGLPPMAMCQSAYAAQEHYVTGLADKMMALARQENDPTRLRQQIEAVLQRHTDVRAVARFALGPYARKVSDTQMAEYNGLVLKYIAGIFSDNVRSFAGSNLHVDGSAFDAGYTIVSSRMQFPTGKQLQLKWRVYTYKNRHHVADVNVFGIWLSMRMREKFVGVLRQNNGSMAALLGFLRQV